MQKLVFMIIGELGIGSCCWTNIGYLKAVLDQLPHFVETAVEFCDIVSLEQKVKKVIKEGYKYYCFSVLQYNYLDCLQYTKEIKSLYPEAVCIWGNLQAVSNAQYIMKNHLEVDFITIGEGELTLAELVKRLVEGADLSLCRGIYYRQEGHVVFTGRRELISDLDSLPFPDRSFIPIKYRNPIYMLQIPVFASRGCMGTCTFCDAKVISTDSSGKSCVRTRSISNVISELRIIRKDFQNPCVYFMDSTFSPNSKDAYIRLEELYHEIKESDIALHFFMNMRAEQFNDRFLVSLKKLQKVGLKYLFVGFESGNADDLKLYGKRATLEDNRNALNYLKKFGFLDIRSSFGFDFGFINFNPYSTIRTLRKNFEFLTEDGLPTTIYHLTSALRITSSSPISKIIYKDGLLIGDPDLPITDPYAYMYQDLDIFHILEVLRKIADQIAFRDYYREIDYYSIYQHYSQEYEDRYLKYKGALFDYMHVNKERILWIYQMILDCTEVGKEMPMELEEQVVELTQYNMEQSDKLNRLIRWMNHFILREKTQIRK